MPDALPLRILSTDFDGTLFAEFENPPIPLELETIIADLQARGAKWVINTGRDMSSLMEALARSGVRIEPDYLVLVEREIHCHHDSQYLGLEEWNEPCARAHAEIFKQVSQDLPKLIEWIESRFHARIYEDAYSPFCLIAGDNKDADVIHDYLSEYCRTVPHLTVVRNDVYARFSHEAYNKGTALAELSRRIGVARENVFAVGDHLNDLPMLSKEFAHCLAAPSNSIEAVKRSVLEQGGFLSQLSHGNGVADAIKYYLKNRSG